MRLRMLTACLLLAVLGAPPGARAASAPPQSSMTDPEGGTFADGVYTNPYFGLRYSLPAGWTAGPRPSPPSANGYYVLATPAPPAGIKATMLIAAQDQFFAGRSTADAESLVRGLVQTHSEPGATPPEPERVKIAGRDFVRLEMPGTPLPRIVLATTIRCHVVIFTFADPDPEGLDRLASSLDRLSFASASAPPACVAGYASAQTIRHRVEPAAAGSSLVTIPVRIVIGPDGRVRHVHVIRATPAERRSIEDALAQWRFVPYRENGKPAAVETGLHVKFGAEPGDRGG